jgi:molybdopterin-containing oxidoreductase family membrane subunit
VGRLTYADIQEDVLQGTRPPRALYLFVMATLAGIVAWAVFCWCYQVQKGMGVAGINQPVGWAVYITNFVFWVGIGHAGTLVSAILYLVRSRWRTSISRAAEAMTIFAVMTAGLFPLVHLGRLWVFYWIVPYPSERQLWPNFISPLVWDVCAVTTYLIVSIVFWYVGLVPDAAAARDRAAAKLGADHPRTRLYHRLALGWTGSTLQWHHFGRSYLFFAALATPLVISVHSVVSWDFAMANLPGWHTTIFAPYFVAGAIHSGLAMVLVLMIPMRRLLRLQRVIRPEHFDAVAKTMLVTALIVGYAYLIEPFIAWYSGDRIEGQFAIWRASGWIAPFYWALTAFNVVAPLVFLFRAARYSLKTLFVVGILVNVGMWLERWVIIAGSLGHDFLPHNWRPYAPTWVELSISVGSLAFFLFWFLGFSKLLPTVAVADVKEMAAGRLYAREEYSGEKPKRRRRARRSDGGVLAVFTTPEALVAAIRRVKESAFERIEAFSPFRLDEASDLLQKRHSPVRLWTLIGALSGLVGGFALAIGSAMVNNLYVGGKYTPTAVIPYCIVAFEGTILLGVLANLAGMIYHARLGRTALPRGYDRRFTCDRFGLFIACLPEEAPAARDLLSSTHPEEVDVIA